MSSEMLDGQMSYLNEEGKLSEPYLMRSKQESIKLISKAALIDSIGDFSRYSQKQGLSFKVKIDSNFYPKDPNVIDRRSSNDRISGIGNFQNAYGFDASNVMGYEEIIKFATVTAMALDFLEKNTGPGNDKNRKRQRKILNK